MSISEEYFKKDKAKTNLSEKDTKIPRKEKYQEKKVSFDQKMRTSGWKSGELDRVLNDEDNLSWKTHSTEDCRSEIFYKKRMADSSEE